jgi:hypothetical protein
MTVRQNSLSPGHFDRKKAEAREGLPGEEGMVLGDGLAVIGGGVTLFPWHRPLGRLLLHPTGDINVAFAQPLAAGQAAIFLHHNWGILGGPD